MVQPHGILAKNIVDELSAGTIVIIRDRLLQMQRAGKKVYRLESGDPSFTLAPHIAKAITDALKQGKTHYTDSAGIPALRDAIAKKLREKNNIKNADSEHVVVTNGGMNGLYIVFRALLAPNDKVLIPDPMWTEIGENIRLAGGIPVSINIENYVDNIKKYMYDDKVRAIFINSPHNPTGKVMNKSELQEIISIAHDHNLWVVSDEAYEDIIYDKHKHISPGSLYPNTVSIYSMSKTYAMSGLRLGYVHTSDDYLISKLKKLLRCTINGVNSITQYGALAALTGPQDFIEKMRKEYEKRRDILYTAVLKTRYLEPIKPEGAFYLWCKIKAFPPNVNNSVRMSEYILENLGVGSSPGIVFGNGGKRAIRFAFSADTEQITEAAELIKTQL